MVVLPRTWETGGSGVQGRSHYKANWHTSVPWNSSLIVMVSVARKRQTPTVSTSVPRVWQAWFCVFNLGRAFSRGIASNECFCMELLEATAWLKWPQAASLSDARYTSGGTAQGNVIPPHNFNFNKKKKKNYICQALCNRQDKYRVSLPVCKHLPFRPYRT